MLQATQLSEYCRKYNPQWTCIMPKGCPPKAILVPYEHPFFRLSVKVKGFSETDFMSYAELDPQRHWGDMMPLAVGLSLMDSESKARKNLKLPMFRTYKGIISLVLNPQDGVVKQTGVHRSHFTWWRTKSFQISTAKMLAI